MDEKENVGVIRCFRCDQCRHVSGSPKLFCPQCGHPGTMVEEKVQKGVILDFVLVAYPPENLKHVGSYVSVLVKLDNGCSLFGIVSEEPNRVEVGKVVIPSQFNFQTKEFFFKPL
jgi:uncharacterized OB-fold protein